MSLSITLLHKVNIVGTDEWHIVLAREFYQLLVYDALLLVGLVVCTLYGRFVELKLEVVILAKEILVPQNRLLGLLETIVLNESRNLATKTSRCAYKTFVVLLQLTTVGTRTVVESVGPRLRYYLQKVFVTFEVLCQEYKVVSASVGLLALESQITTTSNIYLAANDRFEWWDSLRRDNLFACSHRIETKILLHRCEIVNRRCQLRKSLGLLLAWLEVFIFFFSSLNLGLESRLLRLERGE